MYFIHFTVIGLNTLKVYFEGLVLSLLQYCKFCVDTIVLSFARKCNQHTSAKYAIWFLLLDDCYRVRLWSWSRYFFCCKLLVIKYSNELYCSKVERPFHYYLIGRSTRPPDQWCRRIDRADVDVTSQDWDSCSVPAQHSYHWEEFRRC